VGSYDPHSEDEDPPAGEEFAERPYGARPYGARPYGARPYGARPYGARPYGPRPYGARPYGARPYGARPYGARPYGARPYGARPYGARPYGARPSPTDIFDPEEWAAEIAELVCERSAVIRLGAMLTFATDELQVPVTDAATGFRAPGAPGPAPAPVQSIALRPGDWRLEATVALPIRLAPGLAADPELAFALKSDLADALALGADEAFLAGAAVGGPQGISDLVGRTGPAAGGGQRLQRLRDMAATIRDAHPVRNPGWILHPNALDDIARFLTRNGVVQAAQGRAVDTFPLLRYDGADGGMLLGLPFVTSNAAFGQNRPRVYLSGDWEEALIGLHPYFVTVAVPGASDAPGAPADPGEVVIAASLPLDFALRRPAAFAWSVS
jgi:HK97 family phage major capsid protein